MSEQQAESGETSDTTSTGPIASIDPSTNSLYRRYRPGSFDAAEFVGQEPIVRTLRNAIMLGRVGHAYLFCGPRGTGKTSMARILAKAINCLAPNEERPCNKCASCMAINSGSTTDVIEIDAASNRGIDDIRDLRDRVRYSPSELHSKVYIIDEAHQITGAAANAFLKTLEEPPAHAIFILATTDPDELLPTIVSRCQRYDFRSIEQSAMVARLQQVADAESIQVTNDGYQEIARNATGSLRDALGILDLVAAHSHGQADPVNAEAVRNLLGLSHSKVVAQIVRSVAAGEPGPALTALNHALEEGSDPRQLNRQCVALLRQLLYAVASPDAESDPMLADIGKSADLATWIRVAARFNETEFRIRHTLFPQLPLEIAIVESALLIRDSNPDRPKPTNEPTGPEPVAPPVRSEPADVVQLSTSETPPRRLREAVQQTRSPEPVNKTDAAPVVDSPPPAVIMNGEPISMDQLRDLWPRIRDQVKSQNRRIEALLQSTDPGSVTATSITLLAEFPFHRDKLNADDSRLLIQEVVATITGRRYAINALLRDEFRAMEQKQQAQEPGAQAAAPQAIENTDKTDDERVVEVAENLFGAIEDV